MLHVDHEPGEADSTAPVVGDVLNAWRRQERILSRLTPGSPEHLQAALEAERLRREYQRLVAGRMQETSETDDSRER